MTRLDLWVMYWVELAAAVVGIVTLGVYRPGWEFDFAAWATLRRNKGASK